MIKFCAKDLEKKPDNKISLELDEPIQLEKDTEIAGNTTGEVEFSLRNNFLLVKGNVKSPVTLLCDRCSKEYNTTLDFHIDEAIEINDNVVLSEDEKEFTSDDIHEQITSKERVDVKDYIRQYIILNIPMKKICSENCTNEEVEKLNNKEIIDPRWEKLLSYKEKENKGE